MTIGRLAKAGSVPASTIRYYERAGLLEASGRTEGNYRVYGPGELERLRFIRAAQAVGFTLVDISELLNFRDGEEDPCGDVQEIIGDRLGELDQRLKDLKRLKTVLNAYLKRCRADNEDGHCEVIDDLTAASSSPATK